MKRQLNITRLISYIAVFALVVIMAVGSTFSWYPRTTNSTDETVKSLNYSVSGKVNSTSVKTIITYAGDNDNGKITYTDEASGAITALPGKVNYFKTVIADKDPATDNINNAGDSIVSLYLKGLTLKSNMGGTIHVGIVTPEKTYTLYTGSTDAETGYIVVPTICIEDNVVISSGGSTEVEWFIQVDSSYEGSGTIELGGMYVMYN